jgi:FAD/FMN-containing dehydrogenase
MHQNASYNSCGDATTKVDAITNRLAASVWLQVLEHCNARRLAVVPQGGNSSLAGGSVPCFDEVVLSTAAMKNFISFEKASADTC